MNVHMFFQILLTGEVLKTDLALEQCKPHMKYVRVSSEVKPAGVGFTAVFERTYQYNFHCFILINHGLIKQYGL